MPIRIEEIDSSKLQVVFRGLDREQTDELLRRIAWDYRQVTREQALSADRRMELERRVAELEAQVNSRQDDFTRALVERDRRATAELRTRCAALDAEVEQLQRSLREYEGRDELTRALLASAQRCVREMRKSVRSDCDAFLKAAHRRAAEIEKEALMGLKHSTNEVTRLRNLETDLKTQLRQMIETVIDDNGTDAARRRSRAI